MEYVKKYGSKIAKREAKNPNVFPTILEPSKYMKVTTAADITNINNRETNTVPRGDSRRYRRAAKVTIKGIPTPN